MRQRILDIFDESIRLKQAARERFAERIVTAVDGCVERLERGGRIYLLGNGGSAADAIHWAGELVGRFTLERPGIPAVALVTDPSIMTAVANDYHFDTIFARQLSALSRPGDVVFAISTSGNSANVLAALDVAAERNLFRLGFTGEGGGKIRDRVDVLFDVPSRTTARIQEVHALLGHTICELIEARLYGDQRH